jgi:hypothetical protein
MCHIGDHGQCLSAGLLNEVDRLSELRSRTGGHRYRGARHGEGLGYGTPNTPTATGDDRDMPGKVAPRTRCASARCKIDVTRDISRLIGCHGMSLSRCEV